MLNGDSVSTSMNVGFIPLGSVLVNRRLGGVHSANDKRPSPPRAGWEAGVSGAERESRCLYAIAAG